MKEAAALFAQKGYAGVTLKEIKNAANVNIALISYYFGGKAKLYKTILDQQLLLIDTAVNYTKMQNISSIMKIRCFAEQIDSIKLYNPNFERLLNFAIISGVDNDKSARDSIRKVQQLMVDCIEEAIEFGICKSSFDKQYMGTLLCNVLFNFSISTSYDFLPALNVLLETMLNSHIKDDFGG